MGWFEKRNVFSESKSEQICENCGEKFWLPRCKSGLYKTCSSECGKSRQDKVHNELMDFRKKECAECGITFFPRKQQINKGQGVFCSVICSVKNTAKHLHTRENRAKAAVTKRQSFLDGKWHGLRGSDNPRWIGGKEFHKKRTPEEVNATRRAYLKNNPDKAREFSSKRYGKRTGKLPKGTIERIGVSQKWLCVICRLKIKNNFHADHINPLARGGKHEAGNIQLLCPACNLKKSAKDPIEYMQSQGFLL